MKNLKLALILFLGIILLSVACEKDDNATVDVVKQLKKYTIDGEELLFTYDNNRISSIVYKQLGVIKYTEEYVYNGDKLLKRAIYDTNGLNTTLMFRNHNSYDLPTYAANYSESDNDTLPSTASLYAYNGNRLTEQKYIEYDYKQEWAYDYIFTYMNDNVIRDSIYFSIDTLVGESVITKSYEFDNMKNPGKDIGLFSDFRFNNNRFLNLINKNNITMSKWIEPDGTVVPEISFNLYYEYDADNYPIKCTMISFDNSMVTNIKYEY